jgi:hydroxyacylglutathione hydrolase
VTAADLDVYRTLGGVVTSIERIDMAEMERRRLAGGVHILDVRGQTDFAAAHVPGAQNIAHTRLFLRLAEVPTDQPVLVHCASGARSAHAAALLARHGIRATTVADTFARYGAPITAATASA